MTGKPELHYRFASAAEREAAARLLADARLPGADLDASGVVLLVAAAGAQLAGCVGVEPHGEAGLLRSLCVAPEFRRRGFGRELVRRAEALAETGGLTELYLLSIDTVAFWRALGYAEVPRAAVPAAVASSAEFAALCPASATAMQRRLGVAAGALVLTAILTVRRDALAAFREFETQAAAVMRSHGGRIERTQVVAPDGSPEALKELHVVTFPSAEAYDAYRRDARLAALAPLRARSVLASEIFAGEKGPDYAALAASARP